jgi:hypothetical protein
MILIGNPETAPKELKSNPSHGGGSQPKPSMSRIESAEYSSFFF